MQNAMNMICGRRFLEALLILGGIWLLFRQLPDYAATLYVAIFSSAWVSESDLGRTQLLILQSVHLGASVACGLLLIIMRSWLARSLMPGETRGVSLQSSALVAAGAALIGTYFIIWGFVELGTHYMLARDSRAEPFVRWRGVFSSTAGLVLFLLSAWFGRVWAVLERRLRDGA
jgi:hypothetical protein